MASTARTVEVIAPHAFRTETQTATEDLGAITKVRCWLDGNPKGRVLIGVGPLAAGSRSLDAIAAALPILSTRDIALGVAWMPSDTCVRTSDYTRDPRTTTLALGTARGGFRAGPLLDHAYGASVSREGLSAVILCADNFFEECRGGPVLDDGCGAGRVFRPGDRMPALIDKGRALHRRGVRTLIAGDFTGCDCEAQFRTLASAIGGTCVSWNGNQARRSIERIAVWASEGRAGLVRLERLTRKPMLERIVGWRAR